MCVVSIWGFHNDLASLVQSKKAHFHALLWGEKKDAKIMPEEPTGTMLMSTFDIVYIFPNPKENQKIFETMTSYVGGRTTKQTDWF